MTGLTILQIAHDHPDWTPGGSEIVAHDLARALDARDGVAARLLVASTSLQRPGAVPGTLGAHGPDFVIHTGTYDRFMMARLDGPAWIGALGRVLDTVRPDIVHLHGLDRIGAEVVPVLRRLAPEARIVLTLHDYQLICPNDGLLLTTEGARCMGARPDACRRCFPGQGAARHALRQAQLLALLAGVDVFIAPSVFLRDRFVAWGIEPERILLVPNAVAVPGVDRLPEPGRARRDRFAFFGNIAPHKGALVLLEAAARLKRSGDDDDLRVTLHGGLGWAEDAFRDAFEAKLRVASPLALHLGPYDRGDVLGLMRQADWIVVPSIWWENAPLVIHEARAAGRPVICSGIGGMAELVEHGVDGLHVPPGDAATLAETLRAAADPALWARLAGKAAPADHAAFADAHLDIYQSLRHRVAA